MEDTTPKHSSFFKLPHIGLRKWKSILAIMIGFLIWQGIRLLFPDLEVHPLFIYIYGILEMRESSEKTKNMGALRIKATFVAILIGLPFLLLRIAIHRQLDNLWLLTAIDLLFVLIGSMLALEIGEKVGCKAFTGLVAAIYIIMLIFHAGEDRYVYATLRAFQTVIGVFVAWLVNVVILPYPSKKMQRMKDCECVSSTGEQL